MARAYLLSAARPIGLLVIRFMWHIIFLFGPLIREESLNFLMTFVKLPGLRLHGNEISAVFIIKSIYL